MTPRRSVIVDTTVRLVFDAALVLSVYLLFAGHNQPGGGFVGGLVAAAAFALRYISGGLEEVHAAAPVPPWGFLSAGLLLAVLAALLPVVWGAGPLDQTAVQGDLLLVGHVKLTTATVFDTGVYLVVVGVVLMAFEGLGEYWRDAARPPPGDGK